MEIYALAITGFTVLMVSLLERTKNSYVRKMLDWIPAILFAYIIPAIFTHVFGLDLSKVFLHGISKDFIITTAIVTVMSALSFRQLRIVGIRPIIVFVSGSFAVAMLPVVLFMLTGVFQPGTHELIGQEGYWKGLVPIVGSWIGGSTSQLVLKEVVECPEDMFLAILVMDNVLVNIWTILMFKLIQRSERWNRLFGIDDPFTDFVPDEVEFSPRTSTGIVYTLVICVAAVIICHFTIRSFIGKILILSFAGLLFGNALKFWNHAVVLKFGGILIVVIMAVLGLKLNFENFSMPWQIIVFAIIWLVLHYVFMIIVAKLMNVHMAWVPIASMANVGGISTAPAVTKAYNEEWMPHAILLAILSMVSGTTWGLLTIWLFQAIL